MLKRFLNHEKGITGLETAIILIAFVVVAAVFAYTALSAGLFSTQKSQEAVYSGLKEAQSTLELRGPVIATASAASATANISTIVFTVSAVLGGEPIDFTPPTTGTNGIVTTGSNKVIISYIDDDQQVNNLYWSVQAVGKDDGDKILNNDEKFQITVGDTGSNGDLTKALGASNQLGANKTFSLVLDSPSGAVMTIERTTPAYINKINNLK